MREQLRVAAYAVCVRDGQLLLARWVSRDGEKKWTLPGGGMDHGEDPYDTVIREVAEETGYDVEPTALLGIESARRDHPRRLGIPVDFQALRILYEARITGGHLRHELNGSTDMAAWHPLTDIPTLTRADVIDTALTLHNSRPPTGHIPPPTTP
ncbi:NUDIX hydrolase [Streptomyces adelaidensis]|uniref:NUDIX hydrolase n=1 Tax=Streptomyces adelaidensis TaxID=2796465 RepID=UPI001908BA5D|nr:NUDIX hydrolase [Streptomyces adelaidensis]